jgi:hypothetical protein
MTGRTHRTDRRLAIVAALIFLLQQGLLPVLHLPLGTLAGVASATAAAGVHHHHDGDGKSDHAGHGPCHFCRLIGAALPPPSPVVLFSLAPVSSIRVVPVADLRPAASFSRAHGVRAPPPDADPDEEPGIA